MSYTETYIGRLHKLPGDPEEIAKKILLGDNPDHQLEWENWVQELQESEKDGYHKWHVIDGELYVSKHENFKEEGFFKATILPNGDIDYAIQFYNGGCCMSEALESAIKKAKNGS